MNDEQKDYLRCDTEAVLNHKYTREQLLRGLGAPAPSASPIFDTIAADRFASDVTTLTVDNPAEPSREALLAQGFSEGVNFIDDQPGPWGAGMVAGRAEAARRRAAVTEQGESHG